MDKISIRIPAAPEYIRIVRLVASGLASRLDFTIEEIEDLKIAVDELCAYLTGSQGREGTLEISFEIDGAQISIDGTGHFRPGDKVRTQLTELSRMILDTVVDSASLEHAQGSPHFSLSKTRA
jgi:serine/threonine-protein kinase RsbW